MNLKLIVLIFLLLYTAPVSALEAPQLAGRVNDLARMLPPEALQRLEHKLAVFERETTNQVVVLTVSSLQGDNIDAFAIRVAEAWKIGQKGRDNGVLMVLAQAERKVRIEVGMGLQGALPDITAARIIRDVMRPHLKAGNYSQGIDSGVDSIIAATKGEFNATGQTKRQHVAKKKIPSFVNMLLGVVAATAVLGLFSRYLGGIVAAVGLPLVSYLAFPGIGIVTLLLLGIFGLFAGLLLCMALSSMFGSGGGYWGGGFGGWNGGFSGGGGGSAGGNDTFAGGDGNFDGGGSSDDY